MSEWKVINRIAVREHNMREADRKKDKEELVLRTQKMFPNYRKYVKNDKISL
jgi:hypothetical protein